MTRPVLIEPLPRDPSQRFWDSDWQTAGEEKRRALQDQRTRELVQRIFETPVPFFLRKLEAAGVKQPADIKGVADLERIPLTVKGELRESEASHPPVGDYRFTDLKRCIRIGQSTGTTGTPTTTLFTRHDLWVECESAARGFWRRGYRPGMVATHAHPSYLYGGGMIVSSAYEYFGLVNLWVPPPETEELAEKGIRAWMRFKPDIPFQGFSLGRYVEICTKLGLDPVKDVGLKVHSGGSSNRRMPLMTAGMECFSHLGSACEKGDGAHLSDDWAIVQAVDPATGREVPEGEWGNLVVTTLDRDNGLLRYDLEEACAVTRRPCGCGETTLRGWWGGRFKDLLAVQGKRFQPREVEDALRGVEGVAQPSLEWVVVRPKEDRAPLVVRVESAEGDSSDVARQCAAALRERLGIDARVEVLARNALPRSAYKANRVVDG